MNARCGVLSIFVEGPRHIQHIYVFSLLFVSIYVNLLSHMFCYYLLFTRQKFVSIRGCLQISLGIFKSVLILLLQAASVVVSGYAEGVCAARFSWMWAYSIPSRYCRAWSVAVGGSWCATIDRFGVHTRMGVTMRSPLRVGT
jgi:hypothetical protein